MHFASLEVWRDAVVDRLWDADIDRAHRRDRGDVQVTTDCTPVGAGLVNGLALRGPSLVLRRDRARIASGTRPIGLGLSVVRRGSARVLLPGREVELGPGDVCLLSGTEPFAKHIGADYAEVLYLAPQRAIEDILGGALRAGAQVVPGHDGFGRVLAAQLSALAEHGAGLGDDARNRLAVSTNNLIGALFGREDEAVHAAKARSLREHQRERVAAVIAEHHADPTLDPPAIAARCRVSLRYLHGLFAGEASVCERLLAHRLEVCRAALAAGPARDGRRSIGEIAFAAGFNHLGHFCRTFKARFGMTPSEARARG